MRTWLEIVNSVNKGERHDACNQDRGMFAIMFSNWTLVSHNWPRWKRGGVFLSGLQHAMDALDSDLPSCSKCIIPGDSTDPAHVLAQQLLDKHSSLKKGEDHRSRYDLWRRLMSVAVRRFISIPSIRCMYNLDQVIVAESTVFYSLLEFGERIQTGEISQEQVAAIDKYVAVAITMMFDELYDRFASICAHDQVCMSKLMKCLRKEYQFSFGLHPACVHTREAIARYGCMVNAWPNQPMLDVVAWGGIHMSAEQNRCQQAAIANALRNKRIQSAWDSDSDD